MKETTQTLWFLAAAAASVLLAVSTRPTVETYEVNDLVGKPLTKAFEPEEAKSLRIVRFDEKTATLRDFEVVEKDGVWSIPSQGGYPADAEQQMARAATGVIDREVLAVAAQTAADHPKYGVVDPLSDLEVGETGVGTRVTLSKDDGSALVDLVIGKSVKGASNQHYVRRATQDVVFVAEVSPEDFSTKFDDWIEPDLLGLSALDIAKVQVKDYTAELVIVGMQPRIEWDRRSDITLAYDDEDGKWRPETLLAYDAEKKEFEPFEVQENQELNEDKLRELRNALDDLRIVDVESKPEGLSADLQAGDDFFKDPESLSSLVTRGFAPVPVGGKMEILSGEGEVICTLKDGVEYVLRFGNLQVSASDDDAKADDEEAGGESPGDEAAEGESEKKDGVNRFLFVMAQLNKDAVQKPELEELPELPGIDANRDDESEDDKPSDATEEADKAAELSDAASDDAKANDAPSDEAKSDEAIVAERKEVELRNQQKLDEYNAALKKAGERVAELNARFGGWYYVVSNDVYQKVRLSREDVVKAKEAKTDASGPPNEPPMNAFGAPGNAPPGLPEMPIDADEPAEGPAEGPAPAAETAPPADAPAADAATPPTGPAPPATTTPPVGDAPPPPATPPAAE